MKRLYAIFFFLTLLFSLKGQEWGNADVAYMIYDIDSSRVVSGLRADVKMTPASVLKLITTASALEMEGAESHIQTQVTTNAVVDSTGVLKGNIYVRGALDPTVESEYLANTEFFKPLISSLQKLGVKRIEGDIVVDGSMVRREAVSGKWVLEDLATYYGVGCYGISVYDNVQNIRMKSGGVGDGVKFTFQYPDAAPQVIDRLEVVSGKTNGIHLYAMPYGNEILVEGIMGKNSSWGEPVAMTNPPKFLSHHLKRRLQESGIVVSGEGREGKAAGERVLYTYKSPRMFNIVRETNFRSNNHYAQHLFRRIGAKGIGTGAATVDAVRTIKNLWEERGVDLSSAAIYDGNGLSPFDAVSPQNLVNLLNYMWRSDNGYFFFYSLPQCGKEGTVAQLFVNSNMYIRAKSGSMSGVQSYAGYIISHGRCYSFCIMVNEFSCSRQQVKSLIEQTITKDICHYEETLR